MSKIHFDVAAAINHACATGAFYEAAREMAPIIGQELNAAMLAENADLKARLSRQSAEIQALRGALEEALPTCDLCDENAFWVQYSRGDEDKYCERHVTGNMLIRHEKYPTISPLHFPLARAIILAASAPTKTEEADKP